MRIANNLPALAAFNSLNATNNKLSKTIRQLSTGLRINSASDDAAGFAISEKMRSQISGLDTALRNSQDGISFLQTAEGALGETNSMLQRMRELAVQASNDSLTSNDRQYIQLEIDEIKKQIDRISDQTQFNKKRLLDGSSGAIWSSNDSNLKAKINGGLTYVNDFGQKISSEGNYRIDIEASGGQTQVQKSNIITIAERTFVKQVTKTPIIETKTVEKEREYVIDLSTGLDNSEQPKAYGDGWEFTTDDNGNKYLRIFESGKYNITGTAPEGTYIEVEKEDELGPGYGYWPIDAEIFMNGVTVDSSNTSINGYDRGLPAFRIGYAASVNMYISGNNTLKGGRHHAAIDMEHGSKLTITSQDGDFSTKGTLTATGGRYCSGIEMKGYSTITINGGTIRALGDSWWGSANAGIGTNGDYHSGGSINGTININGGSITAVGGDVVFSDLGHYS